MIKVLIVKESKMINPFKEYRVSSIIMLVLLIILSGCGFGSKRTNEQTPQAVAESTVYKETAIMDQFNRMAQKRDITAGELITFINETISLVSQQNASAMLITLEKEQQLQLAKMQDNYADDQILQQKLAKDYRGNLTEQYINELSDRPQKELLQETNNSGFKIETAEGFYFPVINYSLYKKYRGNVTPDIAAYIDIMAMESDKMPVKDAALRIGWDEILKRASNQEQFIKQYGSSAKAEDVKLLLKKYLVFALYGANNTPLFRYEDNKMAPEAKMAYGKFVWNNKDDKFSKIMVEYLVVIKQNDYTLSNEVESYRKKAEEGF
jgi:hypothetical protein